MRGLSKAPLPPPLVLNWVKLFETIVNGLDYLAFDLCGAFFKLRTIMRQYARFSGSQFNRGSFNVSSLSNIPLVLQMPQNNPSAVKLRVENKKLAMDTNSRCRC